MPKLSAGLLMYRRTCSELEVLLVHPGGPFWARKDDGAWSIPKGEYSEDEEPLAAARREFEEETGCRPTGPFVELGTFRQSSAKLIRAWAVEGNFDPAHLHSTTFAIEWPPRSGEMRDFPEVDRAAWFTPRVATRKILKGQRAIIDALQSRIAL